MRQTPHVHMVYVPLLTVPPIALGAWSMALSAVAATWVLLLYAITYESILAFVE